MIDEQEEKSRNSSVAFGEVEGHRELERGVRTIGRELACSFCAVLYMQPYINMESKQDYEL